MEVVDIWKAVLVPFVAIKPLGIVKSKALCFKTFISMSARLLLVLYNPTM